MGSHPPSPAAPGGPSADAAPAWLARARPRVLAGIARVSASLLGAPVGLVTGGGAGAQRLLARGGEAEGTGAAAVAAALELCGRVVAEDRAVSRESASLPGAFLGAPVRVGGRAVGALAAFGPGAREWTGDDLVALCELADAAAAELDRARLEAENGRLASGFRKCETRYGLLTGTASVGVYLTDLDGRLTELNEAGAEALGRPLEEVIGRDFREFVAPEDRVGAFAAFQQRIREGNDTRELEMRVLRPTGERRLLLISTAMVVEDGVVTGMHGVARDVTEERAREMQFRRAERMASVAPLLSGVCHELNNPLTSIKSFAELLLLDERSPEDREALEIVQREAHRAAKIVTDLRSVARQRQETGTERSLLDLNEVVRHVLDAQSGELAALRVQVDLAAELPSVWAVRLHVEQVVLQLVANAEQAMREQSGPAELTVRTYAGGVGVVLQVEDSGPGIPADHLDRIFDPFWTTRRPGEGTGLGLSLVNGIVADHGGRIRVDSAPGQGSRFAVELPVAAETPVALGPAEADTGASRALRILVVDDEAAIRYSLTRYMERRGHRVDEAAEGGAALGMLDAAGCDAYDVIVADLRMPGLNGGELLGRLRERGGDLADRLIFITGDADSSDLQCGVDCAGLPMVQKPFELAEIAQVIEAQAGMMVR